MSVQVELQEIQLSKDIVLSNIPAFPPVVLRVLALLGNESVQVSELVEEIASEATLSAQVLRLANSPLFGFLAEIDTVQHAVVALGFSRVQALVTTVAAGGYMKAALQTEALRKCWRHTLASAILSRELARAAAMPADRAYSFGLLHDLGRLGLLVAYPADYDALLHAADRDAVSLLDLEKKRFGLDHCEAGRRLVEQWKLPPEFRVIAGRHHDPPDGGPLDLLAIVHLACNLADTLGYAVVTPLKTTPWDDIRAMLPPEARDRFPADLQMLSELVDRAMGGADTAAAEIIAPAAPTGDASPAAEESPAPATQPEPVNPSEAPLFRLENPSAAWTPGVITATLLTLAAMLSSAYFLFHQ